jgi:hypothetical protein
VEEITVVKESAAARDGLFGFLVVFLIAALVRGLIGAQTTAGDSRRERTRRRATDAAV